VVLFAEDRGGYDISLANIFNDAADKVHGGPGRGAHATTPVVMRTAVVCYVMRTSLQAAANMSVWLISRADKLR
jgi:hypothetical protein